MNEKDLEGKELEKRASLFTPWLEEEATKEFFNIVNKKKQSLVRQLLTAPTESVQNIQSKIEALGNMAYLPQGVIKAYERAKETKEKREKEKAKV